MAESFKLRIVSPRGLLYEDAEVSSLVAWGAEGKLEILPGHVRFITPLRIEEMRIRKGLGRRRQEERWAVSGGFLEVTPDLVTVTTTAAEAAEEIDVERARQTRERALAFLKNGEGEGIGLTRARWSLRRSEIRLRVSTWREAIEKEEKFR